MSYQRIAALVLPFLFVIGVITFVAMKYEITKFSDREPGFIEVQLIDDGRNVQLEYATGLWLMHANSAFSDNKNQITFCVLGGKFKGIGNKIFCKPKTGSAFIILINPGFNVPLKCSLDNNVWKTDDSRVIREP